MYRSSSTYFHPAFTQPRQAAGSRETAAICTLVSYVRATRRLLAARFDQVLYGAATLPRDGSRPRVKTLIWSHE